MKRVCFTLIELLVVVTIIAILASLLLPAIQQARQKARDALCVSNLHQIGAAQFSYADDYETYFPSYGPWSGAGVTNYQWEFRFPAIFRSEYLQGGIAGDPNGITPVSPNWNRLYFNVAANSDRSSSSSPWRLMDDAIGTTRGRESLEFEDAVLACCPNTIRRSTLMLMNYAHADGISLPGATAGAANLNTFKAEAWVRGNYRVFGDMHVSWQKLQDFQRSHIMGSYYEVW